MDVENLFVESKWEILTSLAQDDQSPTELARHTKTSLANISAQLRILEAMDFVASKRLSNVGKGEPRKSYSLNKEFAYLVMASRDASGKRLIKITPEVQPFFNLWLITDPGTARAIIKFMCNNEQIMEKSQALALISKAEKIELLLINDSPGETSHRLHDPGNFLVHVNTLEEFQAGIREGKEYYKDKLKKMSIVFDKTRAFSEMKRGKNEQAR